MLKQRFVVPIFLLFALTGEVAYSQATICAETGFFIHYLQQWMKVRGTCSNTYGFAYVGIGGGGFFLALLGKNQNVPQNIPMGLMNDNTAKADNVDLGGGPNNTVTLKVVNRGVNGTIKGKAGCNLTLRGRRCKYRVQTTSCTRIKRLAIICGTCPEPAPCPDFGDDSIEIFLQGKPHPERCTASLSRLDRRCITCNGPGFSPVDQ